MTDISSIIFTISHTFHTYLVPAVPLHLYYDNSCEASCGDSQGECSQQFTHMIREFTCLHLTKKKHLTSRPVKTFGSILAVTFLGSWTLLFPADLNLALFPKWSQPHLSLPCKDSNGFQACNRANSWLTHLPHLMTKTLLANRCHGRRWVGVGG